MALFIIIRLQLHQFYQKLISAALFHVYPKNISLRVEGYFI